MKTKELILGLIALVWLMVSYVVYNKMTQPARPAQVSTKTVEVLMSQRAIPVGKKLVLADITWKKIKESELASGDVTHKGQSLSSYLQRKLIVAVKANQVIKDYYLPAPITRNSISRHIAQDKYALTIEVTFFSSKFIIPGDFVDLFLIKSSKNRETSGISSERILSGIRVLAVGDATDNAPVVNEKALSMTNSITLEVTPRQASIVSLAKSLGTLSISIQSSLAPSDKQQIAHPDNKLDYNALYTNQPTPPAAKKIILYHGSKAGEYLNK
jgi:pilus assembly protein CpaB